ncbi:MAG: hypothetical protein E7597_02870 [Ruminococcaceae bacterium]|nr:hypothetical protein [Oscillospiraceae bacterium]
MTSKISYIFKRKESKNDKANTNKRPQNNDGKIVLSTWTIKNTILAHFGLSEKQCDIEDLGVIFNISVIDKQSDLFGIDIVIHQTTDIMFLDVSIDGEESHNIEVLELFDSILLTPKTIYTFLKVEVSLYKGYDIIKTYDDVSSYYCKLIYPKLDEFDRKIRLIMYNTYFIVFGADFPQKFNFFINSKGKLNKRRIEKRKGDEIFSDYIFYEYDYTQLIEILFEDKRTAPKGEEPKSDWDLYFSNKIPLLNLEVDIEKLKGYRNKISHCKILTKSDYVEAKDLLSKYCVAFEKAIKLTYTKDFFSKFRSDFENTLKRMTELLETIASYII